MSEELPGRLERSGNIAESSMSDSELDWTINIKQLNEINSAIEHVDPDISVPEFKQRVYEELDIPVDRQRMIFRGKVLEDGKKLSDYGVKNEDCIHLLKRAEPQSSRLSSSARANNTQTAVQPNARPRAQQQGFNFDANELNRIINDQLSRSVVRPRQNRLGRSQPVGDNIEHIYQNLATIDTIDKSISDRNERIRLEKTVKTIKKDSKVRSEEFFNKILNLLDDDAYESDEDRITFNYSNDFSMENYEGVGLEEKNESPSNSVTRNNYNNTENLNHREFKVGQWIDCLDTVNQWLEATVIHTSADKKKIRVHYNGWGTRWDETLDANSNRIARFRTITKNSINCRNLSPTLSHWIDHTPRLVESNNLTQACEKVLKYNERIQKELHRITNDLYGDDCCSLEEARLKKEQEILEIAPKLELLGKAMADLGRGLADRPTLRRRHDVLKVKDNLFSFVNASILPMKLKASVERDRSMNGEWNQTERKELLKGFKYDEQLFGMNQGPNELNLGTRRNRTLELHLHAIVASDLRVNQSNQETAENSSSEEGAVADEANGNNMLGNEVREVEEEPNPDLGENSTRIDEESEVIEDDDE